MVKACYSSSCRCALSDGSASQSGGQRPPLAEELSFSFGPFFTQRLQTGTQFIPERALFETFALNCSSCLGLLLRDKGAEVQSLDQVVKLRNLPENQQETFKTGFTEGFMRSQALTQRTQGMWTISPI
ncbi:hypothetical protein GOODEAATRI_024188 [Goodea atripinnis]|uniref:Uncharacterized protein n=1 Tax=Goodea atripinnis TaxID=208336 RepID=A0ABV0MKB6_9TELE